MKHTHKTVGKDQAQSLTNSLMGDTVQNKGIALQDNRPHMLLQKETNTATSRSPQAPIQRVVEPYGALYRSSFQRAVDPDDLELYKTPEEAQKKDDEFRVIWERRQAGNADREAGKSKASTVSDKSESASSAASSSESIPIEKESAATGSAPKSALGDERKEAEDSNKIHIEQGLIKGTYTLADNTADLHVENKKDGAGLAASDMLNVAELLYGKMIERQKITGVRGVFMLHPTGAAIVKIMVNLLGEALGGKWGKMRARFAKATRTAITGDKLPDKIHANILPEHFHYLEALKGRDAVGIAPKINSKNDKYRLTIQDDYILKDDQYAARNMMDGSREGNALFAKYKASEEDPEENTSAGLDITIYAEQLPAIIAILKSKR